MYKDSAERVTRLLPTAQTRFHTVEEAHGRRRDVAWARGGLTAP